MSKRKPRNKLYRYVFSSPIRTIELYYLDIGDGWLYLFEQETGKFKHTWLQSCVANKDNLIGVNMEYLDDSR